MTNKTWNSGWTGLTVSSFYDNGFASYNGIRKNIKRLSHATIYIIYKTDNPPAESVIKKTVTHEFGHALGYSGHSPTSTDVMYAQAHSSYQLKTAEINHLVQIYELMNQ